MASPTINPAIDPPVRRGEARDIVAPLTLSVATHGTSEFNGASGFISDVGGDISGDIGASVLSPHVGSALSRACRARHSAWRVLLRNRAWCSMASMPVRTA
jgi:hypothetical protein